MKADPPAGTRWPAGARALVVFWGVTGGGLALGAAVLQGMGPSRPLVGAGIARAAVGVPPWNGQTPAPVAALLEPSASVPGAMLPRIAPDGTVPRETYARPTPPTDRPRIALVVSGMGLGEADSLAAIRLLPGAVTLAISPYATNPAPVVDAARAHGHELLATVPMEAGGTGSAGRRALMTGASAEENRLNLEWALGRLQGYAGVTGAGDNGLRGERLAAQISTFGTMLEEVNRRGLYYLDPRPAPLSLPVAMSAAAISAVVDEPPARAEMDERLLAIERMAQERGSAIALAGPPRRATVERLAAWANTLEERGFTLVPVSALLTLPAKDTP